MVRLRNEGSDAYKPETYGQSIMVERRISSDGTSGYSIKNHKGIPFTMNSYHIYQNFSVINLSALQSLYKFNEA